MTDAGLKHLSGLASLESLNYDNALIAGDGIKHLQGLKSPGELRLSKAQIRGDGLAPLEGVASVRKLTLEYAKVTDAQLLRVKWPANLQELSLTGVEIDGTALKPLQNLPKLNELSLYKANMTDDGLTSIAGIESLKSLTHFDDILPDVATVGQEVFGGRRPGRDGFLFPVVPQPELVPHAFALHDDGRSGTRGRRVSEGGEQLPPSCLAPRPRLSATNSEDRTPG